MDADGAVGLGAGLGGEIEELDGGVVLVPLVADEGLHDVALGLAGAGDELAGAEFLLDAAADLGHEIVIFRDVPVGALVLELDLDQLAVAEVEDGAAKALLDEALDGPCLAAGDIVTVHDVGLCAPEEAFEAVRGFAPLEAEGRVDLLGRLGIGGKLGVGGPDRHEDEEGGQERAQR